MGRHVFVGSVMDSLDTTSSSGVAPRTDLAAKGKLMDRAPERVPLSQGIAGHGEGGTDSPPHIVDNKALRQFPSPQPEAPAGPSLLRPTSSMKPESSQISPPERTCANCRVSSTVGRMGTEEWKNQWFCNVCWNKWEFTHPRGGIARAGLGNLFNMGLDGADTSKLHSASGITFGRPPVKPAPKEW